MRNAFAKTITNLARDNEDIVLLAGDIGNKLFDNFKEIAPNRFYNCGVAEANMTGVASGLASSGLRPFTYTITPFNTARCFEQIRLDVCYPNLPVTIVGTGSGLSYAGLGATHHSMEDIAILRTLPNLQIICPADQIEVELAVKSVFLSDKPAYIRLGKKGEPIIHKIKPNFKIGKALQIMDGKDLTILGVGNATAIALECGKELAANNISTDVFSFHSIKPMDTDLLEKIYKENKLIVIVEEHGLIGGASSAVLEWINQNNFNSNKTLCFGGPDKFLSACGNQTEAREFIGLSVDMINKKIINFLRT